MIPFIPFHASLLKVPLRRNPEVVHALLRMMGRPFFGVAVVVGNASPRAFSRRFSSRVRASSTRPLRLCPGVNTTARLAHSMRSGARFTVNRFRLASSFFATSWAFTLGGRSEEHTSELQSLRH